MDVIPLTPQHDDPTRFPVRIWAANARSGAVLGELTDLVESGSTWANALGGGTCEFTVNFGDLRKQDWRNWDWPAIGHVRDLVDPGRRSVILTQGEQCLGEWLLDVSTPQSATELVLSGSGVDTYPARRGVRQTYKWAGGVDQMTAAKTLLDAAFTASSPAITIPAPPASGVDVTAEDRIDAWTTTYGDALTQLCDTDNGLEWAVVPAVSWASGEPETVTRQVVWGHPEIQRATSVVLHRPPAQDRGGNVVSWGRPVDISRLATKAVVLGRGTGKKQVRGSYTDEALLAAGYLPSEQIFTEPEIKKSRTADRRAKRRVVASVTALRMPGPAELVVEDLAGWPQVGDMLTLDVHPTPSDPAQASGVLRAGSVQWTVTAGTVSRVTVSGVEQ